MSTRVDKWEGDDIYTRKIRIYPTRKQRVVLRQWMGTRRFVYNRVLDKIKKGEEKINFYALRDKFVTRKNNPHIEEWQFDTPKDIRAGAIRDLIKNYNTCFSHLKSGLIHSFKMSFCSKKRDNPSIEVPKSALSVHKNRLCIYPKYIPDGIPIARRQKKEIDDIEFDSRLQLKNDRWYLLMPFRKEKSMVGKREPVCSLDPGSRTFQTIYSPGSVIKIRANKDIIKRLHVRLDHMQSLRAKKVIRASHYKRRQRKIHQELNDRIDDLHHKTSHLLTMTYDHILLPPFESQNMVVKNKKRGINRGLLQLKHFRFKEKMIYKCKEKGVQLDICTEEYTTKTCGWCGRLKEMGGAETYECMKCGLKIDRDVNAARNILLKRLSEKGRIPWSYTWVKGLYGT